MKAAAPRHAAGPDRRPGSPVYQGAHDSPRGPPGILALQRAAGNRAVVDVLTSAPSGPPRARGTGGYEQGGEGTGPPARPTVQRDDTLFAVFVSDDRNRNNKNFARRLGREDAARLRAAGTLSRDDRQDVNAKLRFLEGEAKRVYIQEIKPALAAAELNAWKSEMLDQLAAAQSDLQRMLTEDLPVLRKHAAYLRQLAEDAIKAAQVAEVRAAEARSRAAKWRRVLAGLKFVGATFEMVVACPAAETGIGAVGCIHGMTTAKSAWDEAWTGEPSPAPVPEAITAGAEAFFDKKTASMIGDLVDMALSMYVGGRLASTPVSGSAPKATPGKPPGPSGGGGRGPVIADADVLIQASEGNPTALAEIRAGTTFVTPTQYYELMAQKALKRQAFLQAEGVTVKTLGAPAPILAKAAGISRQYGAIVAQQSYGDAVLITYGQITGMEIVTMESRLANFVTKTLKMQTRIRQVPGAR